MRARRENAKSKLLKRALASLVSAAMVVAFTPVVAWGDTAGAFSVTATNGGALSASDYTYENNTLTIKSSTPITISGNTTADHIVVNTGVTANITLSSVNIDVSGAPDACAFKISGGASVNLNLAGDNTLKSSKFEAGLQVPSGSTMTITSASGEGSLTAIGGDDGAGIGGSSNGNGGTVNVYGGTVKATGNDGGAGIGGGGGQEGSDGGTVNVYGGAVEASSAGIGAGIGGGGGSNGGNGGTVCVYGGTVTARGGSHNPGEGAGIGGGGGNGTQSGRGGNGGTVCVYGGTVAAYRGGWAAGIGGGASDNSFLNTNGGALIITGGTFQNIIYHNATAGILPSDSSEHNIQNKPVGSGLQVFENLELPADLTIPEDKTLTIPSGKTLTIPEGKTLTNNGTIINNGTLTNNGTIINKGTITNNGTFSGKQPKDGASAGYLDEHGAEQTCDTAIVVTASDTEWTGGTAENPVWYVVNSDVGINSRVTVNGNVNLILADGCTLNATYGIEVSGNNSLTIYGQTDGTGKLETDKPIVGENAGIGGSAGEGKRNCGTVTINGGAISANARHGAGIGGGGGTSGTAGSGGKITINGGVVSADSEFAAGIGGGYVSNNGDDFGSAGTIAINGGVVTAQTEYIYVGIGGSDGSVTISGGLVTVRCADIGRGIGGGCTLKTQEDGAANGNAVVFAETIEVNGKSGWSGVIIEGVFSSSGFGVARADNGDPTVTVESDKTLANVTVGANATVVIPSSSTLTIKEGGTLTNSGAVYVDGTLTGTVRGNGAVYYSLTLDADGGTVNSGNIPTYYNSNAVTALPTDVTKSGYTFAGWYDGNTKVEQIAQGSVGNKTLTAKWNAVYVPPSDPSYNVPAEGEGGVALKVTVSGSTAVVAEISASALESAAGSGAASITIDLSGLPKGVTQAQLSKTTVDKLLAVVSDEDNAVESVTVNLGGAVLVIDAKALAAVAEQVKGANVTLGVKESSADSLNSAQQKALSPIEVVQLYFTAEIKSGGAEIHDFGGGSVRVSVAFEPRAGHNPARYVVLYVGEDGAIERYGCAWANGMLSFTAPHFSTYAVVYVEDATQAAIDALEALPQASKLKTSQAKEAVKKAEDALEAFAALDGGQRMLVDEALVANAESVVKRGNELVAKADEKAVGKVKDKAFSVKAGKSKSIAFKTKMSAAGTKVVYKKTKGSKYITVTKAGKVTAKKGMRAGKKYTTKVKVTCGATTSYVKITVRTR